MDVEQLLDMFKTQKMNEAEKEANKRKITFKDELERSRKEESIRKATEE